MVMALNFMALRDTQDLMREAMLLHRYATRAVLPVVLPFLDANIAHWPCSVLLPIFGYVLKVAPEEAAPRITRVMQAPGMQGGPCGYYALLVPLGEIQPSPVLEAIAIAEVNART